MTFGERLRDLRSRAGLTQERLAELSGLGKGSIVHWELGRRQPSWENVQALARCLRVSVTEFLTDVDIVKED